VIKANCDLKVKHFCGEMGVDLWSEKQWKQNFENYDVLVMTAQIFLNILRHGFISLQQVNIPSSLDLSNLVIIKYSKKILIEYQGKSISF
jgi:hypothetical protein